MLCNSLLGVISIVKDCLLSIHVISSFHCWYRVPSPYGDKMKYDIKLAEAYLKEMLSSPYGDKLKSVQ